MAKFLQFLLGSLKTLDAAWVGQYERLLTGEAPVLRGTTSRLLAPRVEGARLSNDAPAALRPDNCTGAMLKLIRNSSSKAFLAADGTWTPDIQKAERWYYPEREISQRNLTGVEIYYWFDDYGPTPYDFVIPFDQIT